MKARGLLAAVLLMASARAQYFQQGFQESSSFYSSGPISAVIVNGNLMFSVDGRPIDIDRAKLISEDAYTKILQPNEVPEVRILLPKTRNAVILEYRGHHFESIDNGRIFNAWYNE